MDPKKTNKCRAVSDHTFALRLTKLLVDVEVQRADLLVDVATFGSMQPFVKVVYANQSWKTPKALAGGKAPQWHCHHTFTHTGEDSITFAVLDTAFFFSEREIGRCELSLYEVPPGARAWHLTSNKGEVVGQLVLSFCQRQATFHHGFTNSCDFHGQKTSLLSPSPKHAWTASLAALEHAREDLIQEAARLQGQECKLRLNIDKLSRQKAQNKAQRMCLQQLKQALRHRKEALACEREAVQQESAALSQDRGRLEEMRGRLAVEFSRLRQEKLKLQTHQRLQSKTQQKLTHVSNQLEKRKEVVKRSQRSHSEVVFEEICDELFDSNLLLRV